MSSDCGSCPSSASCSGQASMEEKKGPTEAQKHTNIKHVVVVMSGKGGVGKSSFSALLALSLKRAGHSVGLFDADLTGPSIPKLFGVQGGLEMGDHGVEPLRAASGVSILSMNLLLPKEDDPVVWRGVLLSNVINEFMEEVCWGDLDYLVVDMPPGTGDVALTVLQTFNVDGAVIVTTPQSLSNMIVRKGVKMLELMDIQPIAIAENMSYLSCPDCGKKIPVFGESNVEETSANHNIPILGRFPLDPMLATLGDKGEIENYDGPVRSIMEENLDKIIRSVEARVKF